MALSLSDLKKRKSTLPPRIVIYGGPGVGKTQLTTEFPNPVHIMLEDGFRDHELVTFSDEPLQSYDQLMEAFTALSEEEHDFKTVVIDSLDWLEALVYAKTCERKGWSSIETPGFNKGQIEAEKEWREILQALDYMKHELKMCIVLIAHDKIKPRNDPEAAEPYDRLELKLHEKSAALCIESADIVGYMSINRELIERKSNKTTRAVSSGRRQIRVAPHPAFRTKNGYNMPDVIQLPKGGGFDAIAEHVGTLKALADD